MTRFKELKRIESAIKYKDKKELLWALGYCKMRLKIATMKSHIKYYQNLFYEIEGVLADNFPGDEEQ